MNRISFFLYRLKKKLLNLSIFKKILGLGGIVGLLFTVFSLYQVRFNVYKSLERSQAEKALFTAASLALVLEKKIAKRNLKILHQSVDRVIHNFKEIQYIAIISDDGKLLTHRITPYAPWEKKTKKNVFFSALNSFIFAWNDFFGSSGAGNLSNNQKFMSYHFEEISAKKEVLFAQGLKGKIHTHDGINGPVFAATVPIDQGHLGQLQLGISDKKMGKEIRAVTITFFAALLLSLLIGLVMVYYLTHLLSKPILDLKDATKKILNNDFSQRAKIHYKDEIGHLAIAFNRMASGLQEYQQEVMERDHERLKLIDQIVNLQEQERKSIARELHDQLGPTLSALLLKIQMMVCKKQPENCCLKKGLPVEHCCDLLVAKDLRGHIKGMIDQVHQLSWNMRPSILDDYGLDSALKRYISEVQKMNDMKIDYHQESAQEDRLPSRIEVCLYRIAQEAITNAMKYSQASLLSVVLLQRKHEVVLLIEDNGQGFDTKKRNRVGPQGGMGLISMRERVALNNGNFFIESQKGYGTTVRASMPLT